MPTWTWQEAAEHIAAWEPPPGVRIALAICPRENIVAVRVQDLCGCVSLDARVKPCKPLSTVHGQLDEMAERVLDKARENHAKDRAAQSIVCVVGRAGRPYLEALENSSCRGS